MYTPWETGKDRPEVIFSGIMIGTIGMLVTVGDLFSSDCQTFVNTVNTKGIMGKGIALEFKKQFESTTMFADYRSRCERKVLRVGEPYLWKPLTALQQPLLLDELPAAPSSGGLVKWVLNFPTKDHWRTQSKLPDIIRGLEVFSCSYKDWGVASIAFPALGCGNGGLEWRQVGPVMFRYLNNLDVRVEIFAPPGTPPHQLTVAFLSEGHGAR